MKLRPFPRKDSWYRLEEMRSMDGLYPELSSTLYRTCLKLEFSGIQAAEVLFIQNHHRQVKRFLGHSHLGDTYEMAVSVQSPFDVFVLEPLSKYWFRSPHIVRPMDRVRIVGGYYKPPKPKKWLMKS